jgi:quercetin dioxygenase-like cupin family protein
MAWVTDGSSARTAPDQPFGTPNVRAPLDGVPFHQSTSGVVRTAPVGFPFHVAVHHVSSGEHSPAAYVDPHVHPAGEINVLLGDVRYHYRVDEAAEVVDGPAVRWLPAGVPHAAVVAGGEGTFVCVILAPTDSAFGPAGPGAAALPQPEVTTSVHDAGGTCELVGGAGGAVAVVLAGDDPDGSATWWLPPGSRHQHALGAASATVVHVALAGPAGPEHG